MPTRRMTSRKSQRYAEPLEQAIEMALAPGTFIHDRECFSYTNDDSSGSFGQVVGDLYCGWVRARQAMGASPDDTAVKLIEWMDDDDYGFCYRLEQDLVRVFDKRTHAAFTKICRARFDEAGTRAPKSGAGYRDRAESIRHRFGDILRYLYEARKDVAAYVALAEQTEVSAEDCHAVARMLAARRKPEDALAWVARGKDIDGKTQYGSTVGHRLVELERELLVKLKRGDEALEAAWEDYRRHPCSFTYEDLMKYVPKPQRAEWHEKAIEAAKDAELYHAMDLLVATKEATRLADLVRGTSDRALTELSHSVTEPAAEMLEKEHPVLAARLWLAQGLRIVEAGKSKYYRAALSNLERAKDCFERAGLEAVWQERAHRIRADHKRKSSFMQDFEKLLDGAGPSTRPSFMERAKARFRDRSRKTS